MFKKKGNKTTRARLFYGTLPSSYLSTNRPGGCLVSMETLKPGSEKPGGLATAFPAADQRCSTSISAWARPIWEGPISSLSVCLVSGRETPFVVGFVFFLRPLLLPCCLCLADVDVCRRLSSRENRRRRVCSCDVSPSAESWRSLERFPQQIGEPTSQFSDSFEEKETAQWSTSLLCGNWAIVSVLLFFFLTAA